MVEVPATGPEAAVPLLIFPYNGNGLEALDCLEPAFRLVGFVDDTVSKQGASDDGCAVYSREALARWPEAAVLAVPGSATSFRARLATIDSLGVEHDRFARVIHPSARVSPLARIGRNVLIMAGAVITSNAVIGDHVCILPNSVVHHDSQVGKGTLIGANVTVAGNTTIGENCYIGSGSSIMNGLQIGPGSLVGLGSTVIRHVAADSVVAGNPARKLRSQ